MLSVAKLYTKFLHHLRDTKARHLFYMYYVCTAVFTLDADLLARNQYSEGPATGYLDTCFFLVSLCLKANAEFFSQDPKLPLHSSHVALPT